MAFIHPPCDNSTAMNSFTGQLWWGLQHPPVDCQHAFMQSFFQQRQGNFKLQSLAPSNTLSKPSVVRSIEKRTSLLSSSCITTRFVHPSIVLVTCWSRSINSSRTSTLQRSSLELSRNYFFDSVLSQSVSATIFADEGPCIGFFALSSSALTCGWAFYFALECSPISFVSSITSGMVESFANNKKIAFFHHLVFALPTFLELLCSIPSKGS